MPQAHRVITATLGRSHTQSTRTLTCRDPLPVNSQSQSGKWSGLTHGALGSPITFQLSILTLPTFSLPACGPGPQYLHTSLFSCKRMKWSINHFICMLCNKFPFVLDRAGLYWTASTPVNSRRIINGLQLKKHILGYLSKNGNELSLPPSLTYWSHREASAIVTITRPIGLVAELH